MRGLVPATRRDGMGNAITFSLWEKVAAQPPDEGLRGVAIGCDETVNLLIIHA